jgi:hypothetical protein
MVIELRNEGRVEFGFTQRESQRLNGCQLIVYSIRAWQP